MRKKLEKYNGEYIEVTSKLIKSVRENGYHNLMFGKMIMGDEVLTDHFWTAATNIRNRKSILKELEIGKTYKLRGKIYIYKKLSKKNGSKTVMDYGIKSIRIEEV